MFRSLSKMSSVIKIDGSLGEGGGQILRIALSLSALYGIPIEINNIRAGRAKPGLAGKTGLAAQHLKGVELVRDMCNAKVSGAYIGSTHLEFHPKSLHGHATEFEADIKTAGCICLLIQVALPCALFLPQKSDIVLILKGGTNVNEGPHVEYLTEVIRPILNKFGADFDLVVLKRGYYPKGGGIVHLRITPIKNLNAVDITNLGIPRGISGWAYVSNRSVNEAYKLAIEAKTTLTDELKKNNIQVPPINIESYKEDIRTAVEYGSGINIVCSTTTGCIFGGSASVFPKKIPDMKSPGVTAANDILRPFLSGACVDEHTQDQIIIFMTLAKGISRIKIGNKLTRHTETAIKIAEIMLANRGLRFHLLEDGSAGDSPSYILECEGCGLINNFTE